MSDTKIIEMYVVVYWDKDIGWSTSVYDDYKKARECRGYGDFVGMEKVNCFLPEYYEYKVDKPEES